MDHYQPLRYGRIKKNLAFYTIQTPDCSEELRGDSKGATFAMGHAKSPKGRECQTTREGQRNIRVEGTHSDAAKTRGYKQSDGNTLDASQLSQLLEAFSFPAEEQRLVGLPAIHNLRDVRRSLAWFRDKVPRDWKGLVQRNLIQHVH